MGKSKPKIDGSLTKLPSAFRKVDFRCFLRHSLSETLKFVKFGIRRTCQRRTTQGDEEGTPKPISIHLLKQRIIEFFVTSFLTASFIGAAL